MLVDQNRGSVGGEGVDDERGVEGDVVVAEDGVAEGGGEGGDDLGAAVGGVFGDGPGEGAVGDEVAGEQDEVGGEGVDGADDVLEEVGLSVLDQVDVADLDDAVAVEGAGEVGDTEGAGGDVELVAGEFSGVKRHACGEGAGTEDEVSPIESRRLIGLRTVHTL